MKTLCLIMGLSLYGNSSVKENKSAIERIETIMHLESFTISIERLDLGFLYNRQDFIFEKTMRGLLFTHHHTIDSFENKPLEQTLLQISVIDTLLNFCSSIKSFEIEHSRKHNRIFNHRGTHDFIYVQNHQDLVCISDVYAKAMVRLPEIIEENG